MLLHKACRYVWSMPGGSDSKESVCNAGDPGLIPGLEKFHGEGNSSQLQYSCLENFMDRGAWWLQSMWSQRIRRDWVTNAAGRLPLAYQEAAHLSFERVNPNILSSTIGCLSTFASTAPHASTLAWKIPWMEEPGRLWSMGSLRVRHDWANSLSLFTFMKWRRKWQPTPVFLPGESQGQGSLVGCRLWGRTELDTTEAT